MGRSSLPPSINSTEATKSAFRGQSLGPSSLLVIDTSHLRPILTGEGHGKAALIAASFLIGSYRSSDEISRFRLLWSGFNALYSEIGHNNSNEVTCLTALADYILDGEIRVSRTRHLYERLGRDSLLDNLRWYTFTSNQLCKRNKNNVSYDNDRWRVLDKEIVRHLRPFAYDSKLPHGNSLAHMLTKHAGEVSEDKHIAFLVTWHLYYVGCVSVRGNRSYPLFSSSYVEKGIPIIMRFARSRNARCCGISIEAVLAANNI